MATAWQQGLRTSQSSLDGIGVGKAASNKRAAKGRAALGDISNRSLNNENGGGLGYGGAPKVKKPSNLFKPSFTIGSFDNENSGSRANKQEPKADECSPMAMSPVRTAHSSPLEPIDPCDVNDMHNPKYAAEYVGPIYEHLRSVETKYLPSCSYMDEQTDINIKMRALLVDWLIQVHQKFELLPQTLYLTINLLDRYLERKVIHRRKLQLVGCAAMLAASKYEEIYAPECVDFVNMSADAFSVDDLLKMESVMLNELSFNLTTPSPYTFLRRFMKVACSSAKTQHFATYLVERSLQEYDMLTYVPSMVAASALYIAQIHTDERAPRWSNVLQRHTKYPEEDLKECIETIQRLYSTNQKNYLQAVNKKYSASKYMHVSNISIA